MKPTNYAVVVGSLNIDLVVSAMRPPQKGESVLGTGFGLFPGGKGANQATQLARLGMETYLVGRVGDDVFADLIVASLQSSGVNTKHLIRDNRKGTGKGCVFTDAAGDNWVVVVPEANANWQKGEIESARALIQGARILIVQLEIPLDIVTQAVEYGREGNVTVLLNPSPACPLPDNLLSKIDWLVPNETEASALVNFQVSDERSATQAVHVLQHQGIPTVTVTLGSAGSVTASGKELVFMPAFPVSAVDVTAAGDSFCAALAYAIANQYALTDALRFASAAGALTVTKMGAQPSLPAFDEILSFLAQQEQS
jgi:ribokinase